MDFKKWKALHKVISLLNERKGPHLGAWVRKLFPALVPVAKDEPEFDASKTGLYPMVRGWRRRTQTPKALSL